MPVVKGIVRGNGRQYGHYLNNTKNEQVRIHRIEGTVNTQSLVESLAEMSAYERLTKSDKGMFEAIIRPDFNNPITEWDEVIRTVGKHLGLEKQAYAAAIHTYKGSDHMHLLFSRFDIQTGKMIDVPHYKLKLREARVELEQTLGHEHLLSWQEKKERERQEADRQRQMEAEKIKQFLVNSQEMTLRRKKPSEVLEEAEAQRLQQEQTNGMSM